MMKYHDCIGVNGRNQGGIPSELYICGAGRSIKAFGEVGKILKVLVYTLCPSPCPSSLHCTLDHHSGRIEPTCTASRLEAC
jgi:hypothetical protein